MTIIELPKQNNVSDSLMNIYEETKPSRAGSAIETSVGNTVVFDDYDNVMTKMNRKEFLESVFGPSLNLENLSWIEKIRKILHSTYIHIGVMVLVLLDSLLVTAEVIIDAENKTENESAKLAAEVFKYMGFIILSAVVVFVSFGIEVAFVGGKEDVITIISVLLIFIRFWRIVRIVNGFVLAVEKRSHDKMEQLKVGMNALIAENNNLKQELEKKQKIILEMQENA